MLLLFIYVFIALGFSFLCSIAEAVLLSVTSGYIVMLQQEKRRAGTVLRQLKKNINKPLAAILTLNTIAHTVGAAGAGAQATAVFGSAYLGAASAVLTLLILIVSEIIPKTLGAHYWQTLAPSIAHSLRVLIWLLYPFVLLSEYLTRSLTHGPSLKGFNRDELAAMAELSWRQGLLPKQESRLLKSLLTTHEVKVEDAMTPQTVIFSIPETMTVRQYLKEHPTKRFSRIPVYAGQQDEISGFVLLKDLLLAQYRKQGATAVGDYKRELQAVTDQTALLQALNLLAEEQLQILIVVNEYGGIRGLLTWEDVLETVLGMEIIDEGDKATDMQELARRVWRRRASQMGLDVSEEEDAEEDTDK
ncbi:MAG: CNNM domain-containing protein [Gammaproteobacteria bacterium]